jgi:predicted transcriptional regulator
MKMRRKELVNNERTIMQILEQGGLGFRELHRKAKTHPKWSIGSMQTLSNVLKSLMQKGLVKQNPITKKYGLTKNGKLMAGRDVIAEDILACQYFDTIYLVRWAYWKKPPQIISNSAWLVDRKGEAGREVAIPTLRIRELWDPSVNPIRKIDSWLPQIIKCVKDYSETLGLGVSGELIRRSVECAFQRC